MNAQAWDERLITPERAWQIAEHWDVRPAERGGRLYLDCPRCEQAITRFYPLMTPGFIVSAVVRHAVTHHDQSLSGGAHGGSGSPDSAGQEAGRPDPGRHGGGGGHPGDRPEHQEADPGRSDQPEGGDQR